MLAHRVSTPIWHEGLQATQSHPKATTRPYTRHRLRSTKPPQGSTKAPPRLHQGYPKATLMRPSRHLKARYKPSYVRERNVQFLATPLPPQLYKPNRLLEPVRVMGESRGTRRVLLGAPPASAGPRNISQAYGKPAKDSFPGFGPLRKVGRGRLALSGGRRTVRRAMCKQFPRG